MNYKKYVELVAGLVFLAIAVIHIVKEEPAIYIPATVFGFMFFLQGVNKLRKK